MILDYPGQPPRSTDDAAEIATLLRKGWIARPDAPTVSPSESLRWENGQWVVDQTSLDDLRAQIVRRIKAAAGEHILAVLPQWRQANMTARAVELAEIRESREMTADEAAQHQALHAAWAWVRSVRSASDAAEAEVTAMDRAQLDAWTMPPLPEWGS